MNTTPDSKTLRSAIRAADEKGQVGYLRFLCERYLLEHPDHVPTLLIHARNLISLAQYGAAEAVLDRAELKAPKDRLHLVLAQRGHLLEAKGDFVRAERLFMEAHKRAPHDATYLVYAGSVALRRGDIGRAQKLAAQAADCTDGCIEEAWFNLGGALLSAKRFHDAADCFRKALELDPEYLAAREGLKDVELIIEHEG